MAYTELIKNFSRIRAYMRHFYVSGFQHRTEHHLKSSRSYDNERRRVESWLGDYLTFGQDEEGKRVFLAVDSRSIPENPLYQGFKTKSFTDKDITLHFYLMDILSETEGQTISQVMDELESRLWGFDFADLPDESTVRKKLSEYEKTGLVHKTKQGRDVFYRKAEETVPLASWENAVSFFSEAAPLGVIGSYLNDRFGEKQELFRFKHHFIFSALDSEILYALFEAMGEGMQVTLEQKKQFTLAVPLRLFISVRSGRQHILCWMPKRKSFAMYRVDLIESVKNSGKAELPEDIAQRIEEFTAHLWGIAKKKTDALEHLEMVIRIEETEYFLIQRLEREKRCGRVEQVDERHWKFTADVYDAAELLPWLRTFIGRIVSMTCSNEKVQQRFYEDMNTLYEMYGIGGEHDALS